MSFMKLLLLESRTRVRATLDEQTQFEEIPLSQVIPVRETPVATRFSVAPGGATWPPCCWASLAPARTTSD